MFYQAYLTVKVNFFVMGNTQNYKIPLHCM